MKLSTSDLNNLSKIEMGLATRKKFRWLFICLGTAILGGTLGVYWFFLFTGSPSWASSSAIEPINIVYILCGAYLIGIGINGFIGDPQKELLIKLAKELAKVDEQT